MPRRRVRVPAVGSVVAAVRRPAVIRNGVQVVPTIDDIIRRIRPHIQTFQGKIYGHR